MIKNSDQFLYVEKYRPQTISECILPSSIGKAFSEIVDGGSQIPNMVLSGTAGVGKTTVARALCTELGLDYLMINASMEGNIDTLRNRIRQFASTVSLQGGYKVVILDEADYLNPQSTQPALRNFMEEFSNNCRFILTCNYKNRIIDPILSRCSGYDFTIPTKERPKIAAGFFKRIQSILKEEGVSYDDKVLIALIERYFPDFRKILNEIQRYSGSGSIDTGILSDLSDVDVQSLMKFLKEKNFNSMRKWVVDNLDTEPTVVFRKVYDSMYEYLVPGSIPEVVLLLAEYQYKNAFVADRELNTVACFTEIMVSAEFK